MVPNWRAKSRSVMGLIVAVLLGWYLHSIGWPWWAWLPAAMLSILAFYLASVLCWFAYRKLTYERFARRHKREKQAQG